LIIEYLCIQLRDFSRFWDCKITKKIDTEIRKAKKNAEAGSLRHRLRLSNCIKRKRCSLIFVTFLTYEVGSAETKEYHDTTAQRGSVFVLIRIVARQARHVEAAFAFTVVVRGVVFTALEQATAIGIGKGCHAESENDCDCQY